MLDIREQIAVLQNWQESDCLGVECIDRRCEAADTMEKLLVIKERAEAYLRQDTFSTRCMLGAAIVAVQTEQK